MLFSRRSVARQFFSSAIRGYADKWKNRYLFVVDPAHPGRVYMREKGVFSGLKMASKRSMDRFVLFGSANLFAAAETFGYKPLGIDLSDQKNFFPRLSEEMKRFKHPSLIRQN